MAAPGVQSLKVCSIHLRRCLIATILSNFVDSMVLLEIPMTALSMNPQANLSSLYSVSLPVTVLLARFVTQS